MRTFASGLLLVGLVALPLVGNAEEPAAPAAETAEPKAESRGVGHHLLFYIPNRVFDVFDIVRLRARVGPGVALQARVTELAAVFLGGYTSIWAGLPGPRGRPELPLPLGFDVRAGAQVSVIEATTDRSDERGKGAGPGYGLTEVGAGFQLVLLGLELGVDPLEVLDLATGLLFIDLTKDDF